jgi:hypothetical protein
MKTYFIECEHNIYVDNYTEGETENVNNFGTEGKYKAENPTEAIEKHLNSLGYSFNSDYMQPDEECDEQNKVWYSVLCDVENSEADEKQKNLWKNNKLKLYANNITLYVYEVVSAKIN